MHKSHAYFTLHWLMVLVTAITMVAPAYAVLDTPALDVFGAEAMVAAKTGHKLAPNQCPALPKDGEKLQVMQAVHIALCNNPSTRASWFQLRSRAISLNQTKVSEWIPDVEADASFDRDFDWSNGDGSADTSTSISATLGYTLFDFGVREATIEAAEKSLQASMTSYDSALQGLIATTLDNYYTLLSAAYSLDAAKDGLIFAKESLAAANTRFELGLVAKSDVLQAKATHSQSLLSLEQAENAVQQAHNALMIVMGVDPATDVEVADIDEATLAENDLDIRVQELIKIAKQERKDLQSQQQSLASSIASLEATKRGNLPSVSISASRSVSDFGVDSSSITRSGSIGFSVSIPIFSGFTRSYSIKSSEENIKAQKLGIEKTELDIVQDVWTAYNNYKTAEQSWVTSFDALTSAAELRDIALGRYKAGVGDLLDVQSAQSSYSSAQSSYIDSRFALLTSRVDLIRAVGILNLDNAKPTASLAELQ